MRNGGVAGNEGNGIRTITHNCFIYPKSSSCCWELIHFPFAQQFQHKDRELNMIDINRAGVSTVLVPMMKDDR